MSVVLVAMCIDVRVFSGVDNFTWSRFVADDTLSNPVGHVEVGLHINERQMQVIGIVIKASVDVVHRQLIEQ